MYYEGVEDVCDKCKFCLGGQEENGSDFVCESDEAKVLNVITGKWYQSLCKDMRVDVDCYLFESKK